MKQFVIFRDKESKKIIKYESYKTDRNMTESIDNFNADETKLHSAEIVFDQDLISVLELADKNKRIRESDLRDIENSIDNLSNELYLLKEALNDNSR